MATKPTGATVKDAKSVLDPKRLDNRKISAFKLWHIISEEQDGRLKLTPTGRELVKSENHRKKILTDVIRRIPAYSAVIERAAHQHEDSLSTQDVAAHWHDHFREEVADTDKIIKDQAVCFFHIVTGAGLGTIIAGRHGSPTRISFFAESLTAYIKGKVQVTEPMKDESEVPSEEEQKEPEGRPKTRAKEEAYHKPLGQAIFIAHGKNKKPLEQLKKILDQFKIPYKVAVDEPNLGRPISGKVREIMHSCNCAILVFTADEEFTDKGGKAIFRPSQNVVYELGAAGYLYDNRIVIMKENEVDFPTNFRDLGYISFEKDELEAKATDILKELIGFEIVKVST